MRDNEHRVSVQLVEHFYDVAFRSKKTRIKDREARVNWLKARVRST